MVKMIRHIPSRFILLTSRFIKTNWPVFCWSALYLVIAGALQLYTAYPPDSDTPFHVVVGQLIRKYGILHAFPWTPFSWIADHYTDDKLLFHLMFVPLAHLNWITATRIVGTVAGAAILTVLYLILRGERVHFAGLWALIPLSGSLLFMYRFVLVRPHLLSISLAIIFLWAGSRARYAALAAVSFIYPWAYVAFWQIPCLLLIAAESSRFVAGERVQWKPAVAAFAGMAAGIAFHPNAANLLDYNWIVMYDVLIKNTWLPHVGFEMGSELNPYPLGGWAQGLSVSVLMTISAAILAWRHRRDNVISVAFTLAAIGFCILTIRSARFSEYFVPFSVAALALASKSISWRYVGPAILGISLLFTTLVGKPSFAFLAELENEMPPNIASFMQKQIPPGSQVFTTDWDHTGLLMETLPDRRFIVALDPTLFFMKDPEMYRLWYRICREAPPGSAEIIRSRFGARYVLGLNIAGSSKLFEQLMSERGVRTLLVTKTWLLFDLGEPMEPRQEPRSP